MAEEAGKERKAEKILMELPRRAVMEFLGEGTGLVDVLIFSCFPVEKGFNKATGNHGADFLSPPMKRQ